MMLHVNIALLHEQAYGLAIHCDASHRGERWYEGLSNLLADLEHQLVMHREVLLVETESE